MTSAPGRQRGAQAASAPPTATYATMGEGGPSIERVQVDVLRFPTDRPESDGTFAWDATTMVLVHVYAAGKAGIGYTYGSRATATLVQDTLIPCIARADSYAVAQSWDAMVHAVRNIGRPGVASMAIGAVDCALWDLKACLLDMPLVGLLGAARADVALYGSGGFTSYSEAQLAEQLGGWVAQGFGRVKMKVGRAPHDDPRRVAVARQAIGAQAELFVDANGAYTRKQSLALAECFAAQAVTWFEEPVSSEDLEGLRLVRDRGPAGMAIAAGEYGYDSVYFRRMLQAGAVDVLQADATRCAGITGFLRAASLCEAFQLPLSSHCAPALHLHASCAAPRVAHMEYFHDHARIEQALFDGAPVPVQGRLRPDLARPGLGLVLKESEARRYRAH